MACSNSFDQRDQDGEIAVVDDATPALKEIDESGDQSAPSLEATEQSLAEAVAPVAPTARFQAYGVSFSYPEELIRDIVFEETEQSQGGEEEILRAGAIPQTIELSLLVDGQADRGPVHIIVKAMREKNGLTYSSISEDERRQLEELEKKLMASQGENGQSDVGEDRTAISFTNGSGIRSILVQEDMDVYRFDGLTNDGRYLVTFDFPLSDASELPAPSLAQLDSIIQSLYIDGAAEALNVTSCVDDAEFVESISIPDGTEIVPGETFVKTWRMRNSGTCTWTERYSWTFKGGDALTLLDASKIDPVAPGEEIDISVTLVAPEAPGSYAGQWQLFGTDQFQGFGPEVYYLITVPSS